MLFISADQTLRPRIFFSPSFFFFVFVFGCCRRHFIKRYVLVIKQAKKSTGLSSTVSVLIQSDAKLLLQHTLKCSWKDSGWVWNDSALTSCNDWCPPGPNNQCSKLQGSPKGSKHRCACLESCHAWCCYSTEWEHLSSDQVHFRLPRPKHMICTHRDLRREGVTPRATPEDPKAESSLWGKDMF